MAAPKAENPTDEETLSIVEGISTIVKNPEALSEEARMAKDFLATQGVEWGLHLLAALLIFFIGKWFAKKIMIAVRKLMVRSKVDDTLVDFVGNMLYALALTFVAIAAISQLGVNTTSLAAVVAAAGLAIGLSLQSSLSNLAAGVMIITFRPFRRGDYVEIANTAGSVQEVNMFTTTLTSPDNKTIIVPNGSVISNNIINYSAMATRRVDLTFGVSYSDDLRKVKAVLHEILEADDRVLKDPEPTIAIGALADSSVNVLCRPWVKSADYWAVYWDLMERVKLRFDEEGITIPFPQRETRMIYLNKPQDV